MLATFRLSLPTDFKFRRGRLCLSTFHDRILSTRLVTGINLIDWLPPPRLPSLSSLWRPLVDNNEIGNVSTLDEMLGGIHIGMVPPETKLPWFVEAAVASTEENPEIMSVERINKLNLWVYVVEMWLFAKVNDLQKISDRIEIPDESTLKAIVDGRNSNCYVSRTKRHILLIKQMIALYQKTKVQLYFSFYLLF